MVNAYGLISVRQRGRSRLPRGHVNFTTRPALIIAPSAPLSIFLSLFLLLPFPPVYLRSRRRGHVLISHGSFLICCSTFHSHRGCGRWASRARKRHWWVTVFLLQSCLFFSEFGIGFLKNFANFTASFSYFANPAFEKQNIQLKQTLVPAAKRPLLRIWLNEKLRNCQNSLREGTTRQRARARTAKNSWGDVSSAMFVEIWSRVDWSSFRVSGKIDARILTRANSPIDALG